MRAFRTWCVGLTLALLWSGWAAASVARPGWSPQHTVNTAAPSNYFFAVSCASAQSCMAVGGASNVSGKQYSGLSNLWSPSGWIYAGPDFPTVVSDGSVHVPSFALNGVSCLPRHYCLAVGSSSYQGSEEAVIERFGGYTWKVQRTPPVGAVNSELNAVSCWSKHGCVAVGDTSDQSQEVPLVERLDGGRWTVQPTPPPVASSDTFLTGVSCSSATACIAVGKSFRTNSISAFAERWDGRNWTIQHMAPPPGDQTRELLAVSCASARACMAVGDSSVSEYKGDSETTLAERWNGKRWRIQHPRNPDTFGYYDNELDGVSCASAHGCVAVGFDSEGPLIEHWNGTRWAVQHARLPGRDNPGFGKLYGVSCPSPDTCTAGGYYLNKNADPKTLAEHRHG